jgi:hypothetical protein
MHNGTVYRWNRPIYDGHGDRYHLRLENRVLPAGPSIVDVLADAAFYYGLVRSLALADRPLWTQMTFDAAEENLHSAARDGIESRLYWPEVGWIGPRELVLRRLLPLAAEGLDGFGVDPVARDRYLGVIEQRCLTGRNGAVWQRRPSPPASAPAPRGRRRCTGCSPTTSSACTPETRCTPGRCERGARIIERRRRRRLRKGADHPPQGRIPARSAQFGNVI